MDNDPMVSYGKNVCEQRYISFREARWFIGAQSFEVFEQLWLASPESTKPHYTMRELAGWLDVHPVTLYAMAAGEFVKIGITRYESPEDRKRSIQSACPLEVRLLGTVRCHRSFETRLHSTLRESRERGEWFRRTPEVEAVISAMLQPSVCTEGSALEEAKEQIRFAEQAQEAERVAKWIAFRDAETEQRHTYAHRDCPACARNKRIRAEEMAL